jgi:poly(3-hydroxybutyrate) depolymerase
MAARLQAGPEYQSARTGRITLPTSDRGVSLDNVLEVPADYDPARRWPLRVSLHGGVGRAAPGPGDPPARPLTNRTQSAGELVLHPRAWSGSEWWTWGQVDNIAKLIDRIKREYNVDESRTYITGISDGGTGVYFFAMRAATPWAACLPLNGQPLVLANPDSGAEGQFFASNLANCPLHVVNGGKDPLYPAASVSPLIAMFRRGGIAVDFQVYPEAGHDVSWWPDERAKFEAFLAAHRRVANPERISWETERTDRYNRFRWLVIDRLGQRASDRPLPDVNRFAVENGRELSLFSRSRQSGRVDITRKGNTFEAETRGVAAFTLLLSPDVVDFSSPVRVVVNGRTVHESRVEKSARTLMAWAARDNDRTMLYGAELKITVP